MPRASTRQEARSPSPERSNQGYAGQRRQDEELAKLKLDDPNTTCKHLFLQSLMSRRVMSRELAERLHRDCIELCSVEDPPSMQEFTDSIARGIELIGFDLKQVKDQETGKILYIVANTVQDTAAKLATEYKPEEIAFFKTIVKKIMEARDMSYCVTQMEAIKGAAAPITRLSAIQLIKSFVAKDWLSLHSSGRLVLSARSLFELLPYLNETYGHEDDEEVELEPRDRSVVFCNYCSKIVTMGYACPNRNCGVRLHTSCTSAAIDGSGLCPDRLVNPEKPCRQVWKKDATTNKFVGTPVGVAALGLGDDAHATSDVGDEEPVSAKKKKRPSGAASSAAKGKGNKKSKTQRVVDDDEDDDEEEEMQDDDEEEEAEFDDDEDDSEDDNVASSRGKSSSRKKR